MEFTIQAFTNRLRELMYTRFPYEPDAIKQKKHKKTPLHIVDVAFWKNPVITIDENTLTFDIGNEESERTYPYYHILEDAPVIRKRGKGTAKTRGSQAKVEDKGKRDYNRVTWNGKTLTKEYSRNVRGKRLNLSKISSYVVDGNGEVKFINREANAYFNTHYHYIEKMMNEQGILDILANEFGLTRKRTQSTGLLEDFLSQGDNEPSIVEAVMSHFNNE